MKNYNANMLLAAVLITLFVLSGCAGKDDMAMDEMKKDTMTTEMKDMSKKHMDTNMAEPMETHMEKKMDTMEKGMEESMDDGMKKME